MKMLVSELSHHPKNREIYTLSNIDDLTRSIGDVGLLTPLIIDKSNRVISGNRRLMAIRELGWVNVDVEVSEVSSRDAVGLLIHYNKQRIKTSRELLNEAKHLIPLYQVGQGRRSDLATSGLQNRSGRTRDLVGSDVGVSGSQIAKLMQIEKANPQLIASIDAGEIRVLQAYKQATNLNSPRKHRRVTIPDGMDENTEFSVRTGD